MSILLVAELVLNDEQRYGEKCPNTNFGNLDVRSPPYFKLTLAVDEYSFPDGNTESSERRELWRKDDRFVLDSRFRYFYSEVLELERLSRGCCELSLVPFPCWP